MRHAACHMHYSGSETCFRVDMFQKVEADKYCTGTTLVPYSCQGSPWQSTMTVVETDTVCKYYT